MNANAIENMENLVNQMTAQIKLLKTEKPVDRSIPKAYEFKGQKWYNVQQLLKALGYATSGDYNSVPGSSNVLANVSHKNLRLFSKYEVTYFFGETNSINNRRYMISEAGARELIAHRRKKVNRVVPEWLGGSKVVLKANNRVKVAAAKVEG